MTSDEEFLFKYGNRPSREPNLSIWDARKEGWQERGKRTFDKIVAGHYLEMSMHAHRSTTQKEIKETLQKI